MVLRLFFLLSTAQRVAQRRAVADSGRGLTGSQAGVLFLLGGPEGAALGEVARKLEASASSMTELIDCMATAGLVVRSADPSDGRAPRLTLTPAGWEARRAAVAGLAELNILMTEGFSAEEIALVARWLDAVRTRFTVPARRRP